jgi:adenosylhomocysteine nucleosidase
MIVAVTGLSREARIVAGPGVITVTGGGHSQLLHQKLERVIQGGVDGLISIGIAGGLMASLKAGDCIIGSEVLEGVDRYAADPSWTKRLSARLPAAIVAPLAGTDAVITKETDKAALFQATGAYAADMESHIVARLARLHRVPFAALRIVSDPADRPLPRLVTTALTSEGNLNYPAVLKAVLAEPGQIPALVRTARDSKTALDALVRCRKALGLRLAGPEGRDPVRDLL